jgi:hypothetical protein
MQNPALAAILWSLASSAPPTAPVAQTLRGQTCPGKAVLNICCDCIGPYFCEQTLIQLPGIDYPECERCFVGVEIAHNCSGILLTTYESFVGGCERGTRKDYFCPSAPGVQPKLNATLWMLCLKCEGPFTL